MGRVLISSLKSLGKNYTLPSDAVGGVLFLYHQLGCFVDQLPSFLVISGFLGLNHQVKIVIRNSHDSLKVFFGQ